MRASEISKAAAAMGRRGYKAKLAKHGIQRIQQIARQNGKLGGRPCKDGTPAQRHQEER